MATLPKLSSNSPNHKKNTIPPESTTNFFDTMAWSEALTPTPNGCFIHLHVIPNSNKTHFPGTYNKWRHTINIHVTQPAKNNQANKEIIHQLSTFFQIPTHHIILVEGKHKRDKTFYLNRYPCEKLKQTLEGHFHGL